MTDRDALDDVFAAANSRLAALTPERCRELEIELVRALPAPRPRPTMLVALLRRFREEPPSEAWRDRCHWTLRRIHARLVRDQARTESVQIALNAYLDGQAEVAARWTDLETVLRPWGER